MEETESVDQVKRRRNLAEVVIGALYAAGAAHQLLFVLRSSEGFYEDMAAVSWIPPARAIVEQLLIPNSVIVTIGVGTLEAALAVAILSRGRAVRPALIVGGAFSLIGAATGGPVETAGYVCLAGLHFWLASKRPRSARILR